jgi:hypothetical protein
MPSSLLGGYINQPKNRGPPVPQTVWLGLQRMYDPALAWNTFGPGAEIDKSQRVQFPHWPVNPSRRTREGRRHPMQVIDASHHDSERRVGCSGLSGYAGAIPTGLVVWVNRFRLPR